MITDMGDPDTLFLLYNWNPQSELWPHTEAPEQQEGRCPCFSAAPQGGTWAWIPARPGTPSWDSDPALRTSAFCAPGVRDVGTWTPAMYLPQGFQETWGHGCWPCVRFAQHPAPSQHPA